MKIHGKVSTFGGPNDTGVSAKEGLAIYEVSQLSEAPEGLFLKDNPSRFGLARRLNPDALYIACRWDYGQTSKAFLRDTTCTVLNPRNGEFSTQVRPVDWGPHEDTGRVMDLSPGLAKLLGLKTDDLAEMELILPGESDAPPPCAPAPTDDTPKIQRPEFPHQSEAASYFGKIEVGQNGRPTARWEARALTTINTPYAMRLAWEPETVVRKMTCHRNVSKSLSQILSEILRHYGSPEAVTAARCDLFGGCYNYRLTRGGATLSQHSYGAAIDLDPDRNPLGREWKPGAGMMPEAVIKIFEDAGWTWGGRWGRPDAMHMQLLRA